MYSDRELCAYLINPKKYKSANIILNFYSLINALSFKTKEGPFLSIKLQWYIDALKQPNNEIVGVTEVDELKKLIIDNNLDKEDFIKLLYAKFEDLKTFPFNNKQQIITHTENTEYVVLKNIALLNNATKEDLIGIKLIAKAFGVLGLVRNFVFFYKNKNVYNIFYNYDEVASNFEEKLKDRAKELVNVAEDFIKSSNNLNPQSSLYKKFLFLNIITKNYIKQIKKANFSLFSADLYNISKKTYLLLLIKNLLN